jgi:WD40 repeat protein
VADGSLVREFVDRDNACHEGAVFGLALSPDGKLAATASDDKTVKVWQFPSGKWIGTLAHGSQASALAFSPDGRTLLSAGREPPIKLWSVPAILDGAITGSPVSPKQTLLGHQDWVHALAVSRQGLLVSGSYDETARLWSLSDGKPRHVLRGHKSYVMFAAISPDGETLATADGDRWAAVSGEVKLWDAATGHLRASLAGQSGPVVFAPNGEILATGTEEGQIRLWHAPKP